MKLIFRYTALLLVTLTAPVLHAQDDLLALVDSSKAEKDYVIATFKSSRVINFHSVETAGRHVLDFRISHHFGELNGGAYNAFGLDGPASIKLSLEYSPDGRFMFGIGRTSYDKVSEGFLKYKLLRQTTDNSIPITMTVFTAINYTALKDPAASINGYDKYGHTTDRLSYASELILARKFNKRLSIQLNEFYVHYNLVEHFLDQNDIFATGAAFRYKLTTRMALTGEYAFRINRYSESFDQYHNEAGIGIDLETGGHVFQLHFTNAYGMNDAQYIPYTSGDWLKGGIRFGFNISRAFSIGKGGSSW